MCEENIRYTNQYDVLWAMNERAQERCRRVTCTFQVPSRLKVTSRNSTIIHLESPYSSQDPKKEVECALAHVH